MRYVVAFIVLALATGAWWLLQTPSTEPLAGTLTIIEIADTPEARERGLSNRSSIPDDYGMLFVFPEAGKYTFWMKDMLASIDIIWLSESYEIIGIEHSVAPETYPQTFSPAVPVRYVLETRASLAEERGWEIGQHLTFPYP